MVVRRVRYDHLSSCTSSGHPGSLVGILDRWWASWIVDGRPGSFIGVLDRLWASWIVGGHLASLGKL